MKKVNSIRRCRLCACEDSFNAFLNIFDDNPELELDIKITKLLPVVVMPWDPLPHLVCTECIMKLNSFNEFYESTIKAEKFLRSFHPSVPEHELENLDPVVHLIEPPMINGTPLKLPPKKRVDCKMKQEVEGMEFVRETQELSRGSEELLPKPPSNCFIVNQITSRDSIFTCRGCFRTFTKQTSAVTHSCVGLEDCHELGTVGVNGEGDAGGKSLPPLKIRLFSIKSGLFVCYLCQTPFENKSELVAHLKEHFDDENWGNSTERKVRQRRRRKGRQQEAVDEDVDWQETHYKTKVTKPGKRKCPTAPRKRGRPRNDFQQQMGACEKCGKPEESLITSTPVRETMEQTTQCWDIPNLSEQVETVDKDIQVVVNSTAEKEPTKPPPEAPPVDDRTVDGTEGAKENVPTVNSTEENVVTLAEDKGPESDWTSEEPVILSVCRTAAQMPVHEDNKSDEVTVLQVVSNRTPTMFSSCIFCDKIFATKEALIAHQNKHLQGFAGLKAETLDWRTASEVRLPSDDETFLCSVCAMTFTSRKTLLEHEQFHQVDGDLLGSKRKIRIALTPSEPYAETERQMPTARGVITITVTAGEQKIPQIELI